MTPKLPRALLVLTAALPLLPGAALGQTTRTYQITIETVPPGAAIYIDDETKIIGYTPNKPKVKQGTHTLILKLEGYQDLKTPLIIDRTSYKKTYSYTLVKAVKSPKLDVRAKNSDANGAEVYVDGASWGPIPVAKDTTIGRHLVEVKKPDFVTYSEWVDLKEGESLTLSAFLEPVKRDSTLRVEGTAGAAVYVDGVLKGSVPALIEKIPPGRHFVEVKKEGFEKFEQWTEFKAGDTATITAALVAEAPKVRYGSVKIFSDQDPAMVYLDGEEKGKTPLTLTEINPGEHFLELRKDGFKNSEQVLKVEADKQSVVRISLERAGPARGTIRVVSPLPDAQVYIDGFQVGSAPIEKTDLTPGRHFIVVKKPGYKDWSKEITIDKDTPPMEMVAELIATGTIKVLTNLPDADIFLDGELLKQKSLPEGTPLTLPDIAVGEHSIMVRLKDHKDFSDSFNVSAGDTKLVQVTLTKLGISPEEALLRRKTISTYSARVIAPGNLAVDIIGGVPYFAEVHFLTGLQVDKNAEIQLPIDVGVDLRIVGSINEIYARGKYQFLNTPVFGVAAEASIGGGLGGAQDQDGNFSFSANNFGLTATGIASLFFRDVLTVSGRLGFHIYSDGSKGENFLELLDAGETRDNGARLMVGLATQIHSSSRVSYNIILQGNPGGIGSGTDPNDGHPRRAMYEVLNFPYANDPLLYIQGGVTLKF